ncbi:hypothetical protein ACX93W_26715 [Paenibacillus sp. CAU 1782]
MSEYRIKVGDWKSKRIFTSAIEAVKSRRNLSTCLQNVEIVKEG